MDTEDKKYKCKRCGKGFNKPQSMYRHASKYCRMQGEMGEKLRDRAFEDLQKRLKEIEIGLERKDTVGKKGSKDKKERKKNSKGGLPKALRNATWNKYIGAGVGTALCFCCRLEPLLQTNFVCGHVHSRARGGKDKLENLRPVCGACNGSMGTKNMEDFAEECGFRSDDRAPLSEEEETLLEELYSTP